MNDEPFRRLSPLTPVVRGFIVVVAAATTSWDDVLRGDLGPTAVVFLLLLIGGGAYGFLSWYLTKFWIGHEELRVDTGVLNRQSRRIRIDRLQGVDIAQPFVARLFGLAELKMDVAGGSDREGSLAFLPLADARELKDVLLARRDATRAEDEVDDGGGAAAVPPGPPAPERTLAHVDLATLALSVLLSPEAVALVLAVLVLTVVTAVTGEGGGFSVALPIIGGFGLLLFKRFTGNYRFTASDGPSGMQVRRGLFDLSSQTIALARVQGIVIREPLLWRRMGWAKLDVSIAGYGQGEGDGPSASTVLPVGPLGVVLFLARHVLGGLDPAGTGLSRPPARARWLAPVGRRLMGAGGDDAVVVSREGLTRRTHVVPHARIQSLRVRQGPLQRRLGLADLIVDSPPGPANVRMRHRSAAEARAWFEAETELSRVARRGG